MTKTGDLEGREVAARDLQSQISCKKSFEFPRPVIGFHRHDQKCKVIAVWATAMLMGPDVVMLDTDSPAATAECIAGVRCTLTVATISYNPLLTSGQA